jgi:hypothetical protein
MDCTNSLCSNDIHFLLQDLYNQPVSKLVEFMIAAYHDNPAINIEVFVHKAERLQDDDKIGEISPDHQHISPFDCNSGRKFSADRRTSYRPIA